MVKRKRCTIEMIEFDVDVLQKDIDDGKCREAHRCMEKLAVARALLKIFPNEASHHVRVTAGHIRFNGGGYRWIANTPKVASKALIDFDRKKPVSPHSYTLTAQCTTKIVPNPRERQKQINEARRRRIAAGIPDKKYSTMTLRKRVIGFR